MESERMRKKDQNRTWCVSQVYLKLSQLLSIAWIKSKC